MRECLAGVASWRLKLNMGLPPSSIIANRGHDALPRAAPNSHPRPFRKPLLSGSEPDQVVNRFQIVEERARFGQIDDREPLVESAAGAGRELSVSTQHTETL